ncbi:hypothetical protein [Maribacter litoralis]|uniref:hypothetical protein n=1 Tax=Maribacter litoralis TaxID=2059726 RepID=UPI003F5CE890
MKVQIKQELGHHVVIRKVQIKDEWRLRKLIPNYFSIILKMTLGIIVEKKNPSVELMVNLDMVIYAPVVGNIYKVQIKDEIED